MAVISVRFNSKEEKILETLKKYFNCDSSNLLKRSLWDLYEEIKDREIIEQYEAREKTSKSGFIKIEDILD
jgi:cytochrome b involved in lipid metabolism